MRKIKGGSKMFERESIINSELKKAKNDNTKEGFMILVKLALQK